MQSFRAAPPNQDLYCHSSFYLRDDGGRNQTRFSDVGELEQSASVYHSNDAVDLSSSSMFQLKSNSFGIVPSNPYYGSALNTSIGSSEMISAGAGVDAGEFMYQRGSMIATALGNCTIENWGESGIADNSQSQQTDTSTDIDIDDKNQFNGAHGGALVVVDSMDQSQAKTGDRKTLRRLAQNREAARKSRLRKKAYVQELENSRVKLAQLEQELLRAREQGMCIGSRTPGDQCHSLTGNGAIAFDMEYARWVDDHQRLMNDLRLSLNSHIADNELHLLVEGVMAHYDEVFRLKSVGAKADVFHMLSGMWKTQAERCFMWLGGFRSSELLKILRNHLEPLTDQQLMGICNLQQSSLQAEDALSQGMEALQQSLVDTLSSATLGPTCSGNVADYMGQMAIAMGKLATLENFLYQADLLRQQTLQQLHRILTTRQAARALLVIGDYSSRLRALSCLWLARPRD